jgi:very-short-patch-repair endonuclease
MIIRSAPNKYWTKSLVFAEARKYQTRSEWKANSLASYKAALREKWLEEAASHMKVVKINWTLDSLKANAAPYPTRGKWKEAQPAAYKTAMTKCLLDQVCAHMALGKMPNRYWTKEKVLESARKFPSIAAWNAAEVTAYNKAKKNNWMKEATAHMHALAMPIGPSIIHQFLMSHDIAYEAEQRFKDHPEVANKPFDFYLPKFNLIIEYHGRQHKNGWRDDPNSKAEIQANDKIKKDWAKNQKINFLEIRVWEVKKADEIGRLIAQTLMSIAKKTKQSLELRQRELTKAELKKVQSGLAFDEDTVLEDAKKYKTRSDWMKGSSKTYRFALAHGLADIATRHMTFVTEHGKWTKENIIQSAKQYARQAEWRANESSAYAIAHRKGWLAEATAHMIKGRIIKQ